MNTSNERDGLIKKAVVDMNGDWHTGIQNTIIDKENAECIFLDDNGYWATCSTWERLCSCERSVDGKIFALCTVSEFEEAAAKWREQQSVETPKVDISQMYCPVNSPDVEAFKKLVGQQFDKEVTIALDERISKCRKDGRDYGVRVSEKDGVTFSRLCWYQHESDYTEFKAPKVNYEELTFGELLRDEQLKLVEHVLNGGNTEYYDKYTEAWEDCLSDDLYFAGDVRYRIKKVTPLTAKELFLREAGNYKTLEEMYDSGKFKIELIVDEE